MQLVENWKAGFEFFLATRWSDWTKLGHLESKYKFNHKTIWFIRYFVSVPLFFGPLFYVAFDAFKVANSIGINTYIIIWLLFNLAIYPLVAFKLCRALGIVNMNRSH